MSRKIFSLSAITVIYLLSISVFAHEGELQETYINEHRNDDAYLAEQARLRESEIPYQVDHWQENFSNYVTKLSTSLLSDLVSYSFAAGGSPAVDGQWGAVTTWPFAFASAANLPDGRILAWGANHTTFFNGGTFTYASTWNPANNSLTSVNHPTHSLFCGVPVMLEDGRVFVAGGDLSGSPSTKMTSLFDYKNSTWTRVQDMNVGRWYNGSVAMPNGKVFTALGDPGSPYPEMWTTGSGWSYLNGASLQAAALDYPTYTEPKNWLPHMHLAPNGQIFHSGHTKQMNYIDTDGNGSVTPVGITNTWNTSNTPSILYNEGLVLQAGGALYTTGNPGTNKAGIIDLNTNIPSRTDISGMNYARIFHNQVALPNGEIMVIGGNTTGIKFSDVGSQLTPEIWNPTTKTWRTVASHTIPRNYHSVALLMTDGRVWSGGGGLCACSADHPDSQVYSPPYLFNSDGSLATRPVITNAPNTVSYGQTITITASSGINKFSLVKMSSTTHALNSDAHYLDVPFISAVDGEYSLTLHTNRNVMTPGYWMLFALNQQGVPSIAKVIKVTTSNSPVITVPEDQTTIVNTNTSLPIQAIDPNGDSLTFDAAGLPLGMTINSLTGVVSGAPISVGSSRVVVSATDGTNIASASFVWTIVNNQAPPTASTIYGSSGGSTFTDSVTADETLASVNIRSGDWVDSIQGMLNTGTLSQHGGNGGNLASVTWPADEYLTRIYGSYGTYVGRITFVTNKGRVLGPYGNAAFGNNSSTFDFTVPAGNEIVGFTGRAGEFLNAIGVLHRFRQFRNQPPVVTPVVNQISNVGESISLPIIASDPDSDVVTFSATGLPPTLVINNTTGLITGTIATVGSYDVIVKVQDAKGGSTAINFTWSVSPSSLTFNPIVTAPTSVNTPINFTASVVSGINPRYKWSFGDGTPETAYSSTAAVSHSYNLPGIYQVKVTATDDSGLTGYAVFAQAIHLAHTPAQPAVSSKMSVSANGAQLWVVNQDNESVSVFNATAHPYAKLAEITVGKAPRSIAQAPDGRMWVTNKESATLSIINPGTFIAQTVSLPFASQPYGVAFAPDGSAAYVALEATGKLLKLNSDTGAPIGSVDVGPTPRHLSITADSSKVLVSRFITKPMAGESTATVQTPLTSGGEVVVVNAATMAVNNTIVLRHSDLQDSSTSGSGIPNYLYAAVISPDGQSAWLPSKQDNVKRGVFRNGNDPDRNIDFQNTVRGINSKINLTTLAEVYSERIDFDNSGIGSAAVYDQSGSYLFVALEATREVAVVDAYAGTVLDRVNVGRAPDSLALSADGKKLFVNNFMDRTVSVIDITGVLGWGDWSPPVVAQLSAVAQEKLTANVLLGKRHFYDAKDLRLARDGYLSCAVCHDDGGHDGRVWDLSGMGEGLRNTISLRGRGGAAHGLLHWSANFDEIQDFEGQIRALAQGTGLMSDADFTATQETLGAPKAGKSADLDALAAYLSSLQTFAPSPSRNADGSLTADAVAGKALFASAGCVQCHGGAAFTDSPSGASHDIGTIKPSSGKRLNSALTALDAPTLRDVWETAPYMHDGSAATLEAAISAHNGISLSGAQISQVAAFVRQIGGTEPEVVVNTPPVVTVTAPGNNATVSGATVAFTATASDSDGIAGVQFKVDGVNVGAEDTSAPYSYSWNSTTATNAVHVITAVARDTTGLTSTSGAVNVTVNNTVNTPPAVAITSPANNATVSGAAVVLTATASDSDGIAGVQFKVDGVNVGAEDTSAPYSYSWNSTTVTNAGHVITAVARDTTGQTTTSTGVNVTVNNTGSTQPDVVVTSLTYSSGVFTSVVKNQGGAATPAGVVIGVGYSVNGVYRTWGAVVGPLAAGASVTVGTNGSPYIIPAGTHSIRAWVDDVNRFAESDDNNNQLTQTITVGGSDTTPPVVSITAPIGGSTVSGSAVSVTANATDNVGVVGVQFKLDGANLGAEDISAPYGVAWNSTAVSNGSHTLTAVARDPDGNTATSAVVTINVNNAAPLDLPDVVVTSVTYSNGAFSCVVKNQGTHATPTGVPVAVGYYVDGVYKTWGSMVGTLAAGASATINTSGATFMIPSGNHTISAHVDDVNRFAELDETNNRLTQSITVP